MEYPSFRCTPDPTLWNSSEVPPSSIERPVTFVPTSNVAWLCNNKGRSTSWLSIPSKNNRCSLLKIVFMQFVQARALRASYTKTRAIHRYHSMLFDLIQAPNAIEPTANDLGSLRNTKKVEIATLLPWRQCAFATWAHWEQCEQCNRTSCRGLGEVL